MPLIQSTFSGLREEIANIIDANPSSYFRITSEYEEVIRRYNEPWRRYHALWHIEYGLRDLLPKLKLVPQTQRQIAIVRAWIYHDIYYAPGFEHNELCSAKIEEQQRPALFSNELGPLVGEHIMATKNHEVPKTAQYPDDTALLIDIDLLRLADSPEQFQEQSEMICDEYSLLVSRAEFFKGRAQWAQTFLGRERIFLTNYFSDKEGLARNNLAQAASRT